MRAENTTKDNNKSVLLATVTSIIRQRQEKQTFLNRMLDLRVKSDGKLYAIGYLVFARRLDIEYENLFCQRKT